MTNVSRRFFLKTSASALGLMPGFNQTASAESTLDNILQAEAKPKQNTDYNFFGLRDEIAELEKILGTNRYENGTIGNHIGRIVYDGTAKLAERYGINFGANDLSVFTVGENIIAKYIGKEKGIFETLTFCPDDSVIEYSYPNLRRLGPMRDSNQNVLFSLEQKIDDYFVRFDELNFFEMRDLIRDCTRQMNLFKEIKNTENYREKIQYLDNQLDSIALGLARMYGLDAFGGFLTIDALRDMIRISWGETSVKNPSSPDKYRQEKFLVIRNNGQRYGTATLTSWDPINDKYVLDDKEPIKVH